ncbi:MAG: helix-turn-helix domain-containing protein [Clostridiales bacterium]|nr:helix-turn-helix domain-containing protein [Clostridiales bacterium]
MEKFNVTYQQIYPWVKKYEEKGIDGLIDRRGKTKPESEISEIDRLKAQNKLLESEKMRLEMENSFVTKPSNVLKNWQR